MRYYISDHHKKEEKNCPGKIMPEKKLKEKVRSADNRDVKIVRPSLIYVHIFIGLNVNCRERGI